MDINYVNQGNYLSEYMCSNIKIYTSCFETFINSSCPDEARQFQGTGHFLHAQCDLLRVANKNISCPLVAVYSSAIFQDLAWFNPLMRLMQTYITFIKYKQMNPAPAGWRDVMTSNADMYITHYKSLLIKIEKLSNVVFYQNPIIFTVCDLDAADVYKDFVTLSTGTQFYQLVNHIIKGFEYI